MDKDVWVSVAGLQFNGTPEGEKIEIMTPGSYSRKRDMHCLTYDEIAGDGGSKRADGQG